MSEENPNANSISPEAERTILVDTLSKGNPRLKAWLDSLALATIQTLTPENITSASSVFLEPLGVSEDAVTASRPIQQAPGASSLPLQSHHTLTTDVIAKLLQLAEAKKMPSHFIQPPTSFGFSPLTSEDELRLSSLRKDTKGSATLEFCLRYLNKFCAERPHISEKAILDVLHTFLPLNTLEAVEYIRMKRDASLHLVYSYLQTHMGNVRSRQEVFQSLSILTSSIGDLEPMQVLDKISKLLLQVSESEAECEMAALRDSLSYLRLLLGPDTFLTLKMYLQDGPFSSLYLICKEQYSEILLSRWKEKRAETRKVRQISHAPALASTDDSPLNNVGQLEFVLRQILGKSNKPLTCFSCGDPNHLIAACPLASAGPHPRQNQNTRPQNTGSASRDSSKPARQSYCSMQCFLHRNASHLNSECFLQLRTDCSIHPGGAHNAANCKRMEYPPITPPRPQGQPRFNPRPQFQQYPPYPNQQTYPQQPAYPSHPQQGPQPQPGRAHHVSNPLHPNPSQIPQPPPVSAPQDSFDLDARTREALIAALTALTE